MNLLCTFVTLLALVPWSCAAPACVDGDRQGEGFSPRDGNESQDVSQANPEGTTLYAASAQEQGPRILGPDPVTLSLSPTDDFRAWVEGRAASRGRLFLRFEDLRMKSAPGSVFNVYVNLPPGSALRGDSAYYVGTFGFYNATRMRPGAPPPVRPESADLPASETLQRLLRDGRLGPELSVTLVPSQPPKAGSEPQIGRVLLLAR